MKKIGVISDTHGHMDDRILHHFKECDEIWHAGDIGNLRVTDALSEIATLRAVYGNIDDHEVRSQFPIDQIFEAEGLKIYITHIAGRPGKYPLRVKEVISKENPDIFICGHSHICMVRKHPMLDVLHINPGAAGKHGFHKVRTLVKFHMDKGVPSKMEVVELGKR
ncbi:MAG: metallophosphoesterase [Cryomorphaceae bacterium]